MDINSNSVIEKPTVISLLKTIPSGIGLDISKNHTGIFIWNGETTEEYGFALEPYEKDDYFAEYKMRRDFKNKLSEIVNGRYFEYCIVEDVYGGDNFDTVRKLLALNTVMDELIFDRVCSVGNFVRWGETKWASMTRHIYKQRGKLKSKIETQGILEFLEYDFYLKNKDLSNPDKKSIFFEDICDACAMLLGVVIQENLNISLAKQSSVKLSDIKMVYIENLEDTYAHRDVRISEEGFIGVDLNLRHLESSIINNIKTHPNDVLCAFIPVDKLGVFGMKHKFTFYESGEGYLLFYKKR